MLFDASSLFVSLLHWLRNEKGGKKRILFHALTVRLPSVGSPPIAILEHITSEHNAFSIRQPLMRLKEMEQNIFRKPNCGPALVTVDHSKSMIKAVLHEFSGESLFQYLDLAYRIVHGNGKKDDFSRTFIHVCAYHFLEMGKRKIKEILKNTKNISQINFAQRNFGRLICYIGEEEIRRFVKDICTVLTIKRSSDLVEYHAPCTDS